MKVCLLSNVNLRRYVLVGSVRIAKHGYEASRELTIGIDGTMLHPQQSFPR